MSEWQPIETAPEVFFMPFLAGKWVNTHWEVWIVRRQASGFFKLPGRGVFLYPTHWMSLPAPPETKP